MNFLSLPQIRDTIRRRLFSNPEQATTVAERLAELEAEETALRKALPELERALWHAELNAANERANVAAAQAAAAKVLSACETEPTDEGLRAADSASRDERLARLMSAKKDKAAEDASQALTAHREQIASVEGSIASVSLEVSHAAITERAHAMADELRMLLSAYEVAYAAAPLTSDGAHFTTPKKAGPMPGELQQAIARLIKW
jgi:hypothetical protein